MNYEEFIEAMKNEVSRTLGVEVSVQVNEAFKNNGVKRVGLAIGKDGESMSPTIYMEDFFSRYQEGEGISELVKSIERLYGQVRIANASPYECLSEYSKIKDKIVYKLINLNANRELLKDVPYEEYMDLAIVPYVRLQETELGCPTMLIQEKHLNLWEVDAKTVLAAAKGNAPRNLPLEFKQITPGKEMYVISNTKKNLGAAVLSYPGVLNQLWEHIGEDFYVLPSSIHEVILARKSFGAEEFRMKQIVKEMNEEEVREEEILSYNVYYYDGKKKELSII